MWQYIVSGFFIIHGLIHYWVGFAPTKDSSSTIIGWTGRSWLLSRFLGDKAVHSIGKLLWLIIAIGYIITGLGYSNILVSHDLWYNLALASSAIGLLTLAMTWGDFSPNNMYFIMGPILDLGIIVLLLWKY